MAARRSFAACMRTASPTQPSRTFSCASPARLLRSPRKRRWTRREHDRGKAYRAERALRLCRAAAAHSQALLAVGGRLALLQSGERAFDRLPGLRAWLT